MNLSVRKLVLLKYIVAFEKLCAKLQSLILAFVIKKTFPDLEWRDKLDIY